MARPEKPPRLVLEPTRNGRRMWCIRYRQMHRGTGCYEEDRERAEQHLLAFDPTRAAKLFRRKKRGVRSDVGEIYFISRTDEAGHPIKIGFSDSSTYHRLKNIQVGSPWPLKILTACRAHHSIERELHDRLASDRVLGEWFHRSDAVEAALRAAQAGALVQWLRA